MPRLRFSAAPFLSLLFALTTLATHATAQQPAPPPPGISAQIAQADQQRAQGLNDDAMHTYESVLAAAPHNAQARDGEVQAAIALALQARRAGDTDGALVYLVRARKYVPDDPTLLLDFALQADTMHIYQDADQALHQALALRPGDPQITYALGRVELDEQEMPEAEAHLRAYLKLKPDDASAHYGLGRLLHMLQRDDEAAAELKKAIELHPVQTESYYELGSIQLDQQQNDEAEANFKKVLARNPAHGGALTGMGMIAYRRKDYPQAETWLKQAVLDAPDYPLAHQYYGLTLQRLGRHDQAEEQLSEARTLAQKQAQEQRGYSLSTAPKP